MAQVGVGEETEDGGSWVKGSGRVGLMWHSNGDHGAPAPPGTKATLARQARSQNGDKIAVCESFQKTFQQIPGGGS